MQQFDQEENELNVENNFKYPHYLSHTHPPQLWKTSSLTAISFSIRKKGGSRKCKEENMWS